jgi:hypothetical protein
MRRRPPSAPAPAAAVALALVAAFVSGAWSCAGVRPTLGPPPPAGIFIYQPPPGERFDYFVYIGNGDRRMEDRQVRLERVRAVMAARCTDPRVTDLYGHMVGTFADGTPHVTYTVGVNCTPHPGEGP